MKELLPRQLSDKERHLLESAIKATKYSYAPYSGYSVGAAILANSGEIITGVNVENAAYGSSICAERAALLHAYSAGIRSIQSIAVVAHKAGVEKDEIVSPCGACRQMLSEASAVSGNEMIVYLSDYQQNKIIKTTISELLPLSFGKKNLEGKK